MTKDESQRYVVQSSVYPLVPEGGIRPFFHAKLIADGTWIVIATAPPENPENAIGVFVAHGLTYDAAVKLTDVLNDYLDHYMMNVVLGMGMLQ